MSMIDSVKAIKTALGTEGPFDHFHIYDGWIEANDREVAAGTPFKWSGGVSVPAKEFEKLVASKDKVSFKVDNDRLIATAGKFKVSIPILDDSHNRIKKSDPDQTFNLDSEFRDVVEVLLSFMATDQTPIWATSLIIENGIMASVSNGSRILTWAEDRWFNQSLMIPRRCLEQIVSVPTPPIMAELSGSRITFTWLDGTWFTTSQTAGGGPKVLAKMIEQWQEPNWKISDSFRKTFDDVSMFVGDSVVLDPGKISGFGDRAEVEDDSDAPANEKGSRWSTWVVELILNNSDNWDPSTHPSPFNGKMIKGVASMISK